jgi:sulfate adenylyltransferase subunit 2
MIDAHLKWLEAESVHILREVASEFQNPVLLYSIGKDSSVLLHLARKAFYPTPPPFPLLHIDTKWKFKDMIEFRDSTAHELELRLLVYVNEAGLAKGINSDYLWFGRPYPRHEDGSASSGPGELRL